jgi:hypothetical protein
VAARAILDTVKSGGRTAADAVQCNEVFKEMEAGARFIKKCYLLMPPLTLADLPTLLLPLPGDIHTPVTPSAGQPALVVTYPGGPHVLMVHLGPLLVTEPSRRTAEAITVTPCIGALCRRAGRHWNRPQASSII